MQYGKPSPAEQAAPSPPMIPCYRGQSTLQIYAALKADLIAFLGRVQRDAGDFVHVKLPFRAFYLVADPQLMQEALAEKSADFVLHGGAARGLARLIGRGILTNQGEAWRQSRTTLQPLFRRCAPEEAAEIVRALTAETLARWRQREPGPLQLNRELVALSFRVLYAVLFGQKPTLADAAEFADAIAVLQSEGMSRHVGGTDALAFLPTPTNRRINRARATLERLARLAAGSHPVAVDDILSLLFAGTESPANTVAWALWLLQQHPEWRERLAASTDGSLVLDQILSETMRLFPAGWAFERYAVHDTTLGGERIPRGSRLLLAPYLLHRHVNYWPEPLRFDPLRFRDALTPAVDTSRRAYLPFGAGPRSCLGSRLGWLQMQIILGELSQAAEWTIDDDPAEPLFPVGSFKLRPSYPMKAMLRWRSVVTPAG